MWVNSAEGRSEKKEEGEAWKRSMVGGFLSFSLLSMLFPLLDGCLRWKKKSHGNVVGASKVRWRLLWWIWSVGSDPVM